MGSGALPRPPCVESFWAARGTVVRSGVGVSDGEGEVGGRTGSGTRGGARCALSRGPPPDARARGAALPRGRARPVHARRESREVAPRAHHLVLRGVRAAPARPEVPSISRGVCVPLQLVLRRGRRATSAAAAGPARTAAARRGAALPRERRRAHGGRPRAPAAERDPGRRRGGDCARGATPGAAPHGREARLLLEPAPPRVRGGSTAAARAAGDRSAARVRRARGRGPRDRRAGRAVRVRQRAASPPCHRRAPRARDAAGDQRRMARVHGRRGISPPRAVALRRARGGGAGRLAGAALLGARRRRRLERVHPRRPAPARSGGAGGARLVLRGRRVRSLGGRAAAHRGRVGGGRGGRRRGRDVRGRRSVPPRACSRRSRAAPAPRRCLGVDVVAPTHRTRASTRCRVRSASTTASSWSVSSPCAAAPASRRVDTSVRRTGTSSTRTRGGSSPAYDWSGSLRDRTRGCEHRGGAADARVGPVRRGRGSRALRAAQDASAEVAIRPARLGAVRAHLRAAGVLPDPHGARDPRGTRRRDRGGDRSRRARVRARRWERQEDRAPARRARAPVRLRAGGHLAGRAARGGGVPAPAVPGPPGPPDRGGLHAAGRAAARRARRAPARGVLPGLDHRQLRAARGRRAAPPHGARRRARRGARHRSRSARKRSGRSSGPTTTPAASRRRST